MDQLLETMTRAALAGGREVMNVYRGEIDVEFKDDKSPLTEADRRSHDAIVAMLERDASDIPLLSEEGAHTAYETRTGWDRYFLIDPLDGTKEFIKRNGEFTVNVALVERHHAGIADVWAPMAGVVYAPDLGELFIGGPFGAYRWTGIAPGTIAPPDRSSAEHLPRAKGADNRPYTIVASRSHMSPETEKFVEERRAEHPDLELISAGSSLKLCRVADGTADEYPRFAPTMEWDTAAGDAVARAAGCRVLAWDKERGEPIGPLPYNKEDLHNSWFLVTRRAEQ
jgi:3'(2'), 5'-bisphosphate nucleotidase